VPSVSHTRQQCRGRRRHRRGVGRAQFIKRPYPDEAIGLICHYMANTPSSYFCLSFGGAVRNDPPGGSAFPHRDALFYSGAAALDWETQYYGSHRQRLRRVKAT
jgi:hypothetical protein